MIDPIQNLLNRSPLFWNITCNLKMHVTFYCDTVNCTEISMYIQYFLTISKLPINTLFSDVSLFPRRSKQFESMAVYYPGNR